MSKNDQELCSWMNRVHSQPRHCEPVTESLVWQSVPLAGRHAVGRLPSFRVQCSMRHSVVADAHIGHKGAIRNDGLWPMWASATTSAFWRAEITNPGASVTGSCLRRPYFLWFLPKENRGKERPLSVSEAFPATIVPFCESKAFWYLGRDLTVVLSPRYPATQNGLA